MQTEPKFGAKSNSRSAIYALLSLLVAFLVILLALGRAPGNLFMMNHGDLIVPFMLIEDLLADPSVLSAWYYPNSLFVFPDWLLAGVIAVISPVDERYWPLLYSAAFHLLLNLAIAFLIRGLTRAQLLNVFWALTAVTVLASITTFNGFNQPLSTLLYLFSGVAAIHSGAILLTIVCITLLLRAMTQGWPPAYIVSLCLLTMLTSFSDQLFIVWFVAPASLLLTTVFITRRDRGALLLVLGLAGCAAVATGISKSIRAQDPGLPQTSIVQSLENFLADLHEVVASGDWMFTLMVALILVMLLRGAGLFIAFILRRPVCVHGYFEVFAATTVVAAMSAPVALGLYISLDQWRYMLVVPVLVVAWTGYMAARFLHFGTIPRSVAVTSPIVAIVAALLVSGESLSHVKEVVYNNPMEECLKRYGKDTGFGDYWTAKSTMFTSRRRIHIIQIDAKGGRFRHIYNKRWFGHRADDDSPVRPEFIIVDRLDQDALEDVFGKADSVVSCAGSKVWLYRELLVWSPVDE